MCCCSHTPVYNQLFPHTVVVSVYVHTFIKEVDRFLIVDSFLIELLFEDGITQISGQFCLKCSLAEYQL